jgi:alpha-glucoside transport system permease protein
MIRLINALLAIIGGVGAALLLYWVLNKLVEALPPKWEERLKPWVFAGVALAAIGLFLIYPAIRTFVLSFANATSTAWVGLENYTDLLTSRDFQITLGNTLLWIAVVPAVVVALGLAVATLADRLGSQGEKWTKSIIFLPLAISGVGAATIWRFIYEARPAGETQIGLLNAVWTALGFDPVAWLTVDTLRFNSFLLMVVVIWGQVGFSMVLLSAAVKGVPVDTLEAARIDGANERQIFFKVTVPQIWGTVITVFITVLITVLKAFDIVFVMTNGNFNTDIIAVRFFNELFRNGDNGRAAAIVVMLMIAVVPVVAYQVRHFRAEEAAR